MLQPAELRPGGPVADQVGVGDQHPRRPLVGAQHADRPAGLHEHRLVVRRAWSACAPSRRSCASRGPPGRCRRRRRGRRGARPPRGRGCSAASAAAPRSASCGRSGWCRAGTARVVLRPWGSPSVRGRMPVAVSSAPSVDQADDGLDLGGEVAVGSGPGDAGGADGVADGAGGGGRLERRAQVEGAGGGEDLDRRARGSGRRSPRRSLRAAASPSRRGPPASPTTGSSRRWPAPPAA